MNQLITLNIRYDIPESEWQKIGEVYRSMDGWLEDQQIPCWYGIEGDPRYIWASVDMATADLKYSKRHGQQTNVRENKYFSGISAEIRPPLRAR